MSFHVSTEIASSNHRQPGWILWLACVGIALAGMLVGAAVVYAKPYKGAELYSNKLVKYGRIETRMRMIRGSSLISAFFAYKNGSEIAGTAWGEIDVEGLGKNDAKTWQSNLITGSPRTTSEKFYTSPTSLADEYHTYQVEWTPEYVSWSFDGKEVRRTEGGQASQLTESQSLRFNVWSSEATGWAGPFDESALPAYMFVNWMRYSRYENGEFVLDFEDDFDSINTGRWSMGNWTFDGNRVDLDPRNVVVKDGTLVLAITKEDATGFSGTVPVDPQGDAKSAPTTPTTPTAPTAPTTTKSDDGGCHMSAGHMGGQGAAWAIGACLLGLVVLVTRRRSRR